MNSQSGILQQEAVAEIAQLSEADLQALIRLEDRRCARRRKVGKAVIGATALLCALSMLYYVFTVHPAPVQMLLPLLFLLHPISIAYGIVQEATRAQEFRSFARIGVQTPRIQLFPVVLTLLHHHSQTRETTRSLTKALKVLLAQPLTGIVLTAEHRSYMNAMLRSPYGDVDLTLALLKALEQIGDETAIPYVDRLAHEPALTANMRRVREAAQECLPFLCMQSERQTQAETLLRASDAASVTTADVLLRPATATPTASPTTELLHPVQEENIVEPTGLPLPSAVPEETVSTLQAGNR